MALAAVLAVGYSYEALCKTHFLSLTAVRAFNQLKLARSRYDEGERDMSHKGNESIQALLSVTTATVLRCLASFVNTNPALHGCISWHAVGMEQLHLSAGFVAVFQQILEIFFHCGDLRFQRRASSLGHAVSLSWKKYKGETITRLLRRIQ